MSVFELGQSCWWNGGCVTNADIWIKSCCVFELLTCCLGLSIGLGLMSPECYAMQEMDTGGI